VEQIDRRPHAAGIQGERGVGVAAPGGLAEDLLADLRAEEVGQLVPPLPDGRSTGPAPADRTAVDGAGPVLRPSGSGWTS